MTLDAASTPLPLVLKRFFDRTGAPDGVLLVAFSGGPDSTALLWGLTRLAATTRLSLHAAHLDHALDDDSPRRAAAARALATRLGVPITVERLRGRRPRAESLEAFARRRRYAFLRRLADRLGAPLIATAHHADDQAETVLLRLLFGSGLTGLGAMRPRSGRLARPLLGRRRAELRADLAGTGLEPVDDPTNRDLDAPRNAVRARLLPHLEARQPETVEGLCRLATAARRAIRTTERAIMPLLEPRALSGLLDGEPRGLAVDRRALERLPEPLLAVALALLHRRAGAPYPASSAARRELERQLRSGAAPGCDCGRGWRWEGDATTLRLAPDASSVGRFAYTLEAPGSVDVPELGLRVRLTRGEVAPWMFSGRIRQAGLAVEMKTPNVVVRNRRPGDLIRPLGSNSRRRLKDLLIDRRIPRLERDRLPLLVIDGDIAWVPGVTIGDRFRLGDQTSAWIAEVEATSSASCPPANPPSSPTRGTIAREKGRGP